MQVLKEHDSTNLKTMLQNKDSVPGMASALQLFVGADADFEKGTASWMQGHVRVGGPLPGYQNHTFAFGETHGSGLASSWRS